MRGQRTGGSAALLKTGRALAFGLRTEQRASLRLHPTFSNGRRARLEIHRVLLTKPKLAAMPKEERVLLLLMGHATNEINVFSKLILMMRKDDPPSQIEDFVEGGQIFIVMRILVGKLHEAWDMFKNHAQSNKEIATTYLKGMKGEGQQALKALNEHFGKKNPITDVRNKVSFHYSDKDDLIEQNFQRLPESEPWEFYLSKTHGNTFYYASEMVITGSVLSVASKSGNDTPAGLAADILSSVVLAVSRSITVLFSHLISDIATARIPDPEVITENLSDGPKISAFCLPYFFDEDDDWVQAGNGGYSSPWFWRGRSG
jgi:hypothetical protein